MNKLQNGQIGLVVLLISAVLLTLGIGIASQSVLETNTATVENTSSKVFNVTEQAIEKALGDLANPGTDFDQDGISVNINVSPKTDILNVAVNEGDVAQLNLDGGSLTNISWTDPGPGNCGAAIVVAFLSGTNGETVTRYAYDKPGCRIGAEDNDFIKNSPPVQCNNTDCTATITSPPNTKLARIKVLYDNTILNAALSGSATQSYTVLAQGQDEGSGETRAIQVVRSMPAVPPIFDYALFSGNGPISQ